MGGHDDPDVALAAASAVILSGLDQDLVIGLVTAEVPVLLDGLLHGLVQLFEQPRRLLEEAVGGLLVQVEAVLGKVVHDALHGHRVEVSQLGDAGDEGTVEAGVHQRGERRPGAYKGVSCLYGMDIVHILIELRGIHPEADYLAGAQRRFPLHPLGEDVVEDGLHLEVHVAPGPVVAAGLAFGGLAFLLRFLFLFRLGRGRLRLLLFGLVLNQFGQPAHLALRLGQAGIAFREQGLQAGNGSLKVCDSRIERGLHVLYGKVQLKDSGI